MSIDFKKSKLCFLALILYAITFLYLNQALAITQKVDRSYERAALLIESPKDSGLIIVEVGKVYWKKMLIKNSIADSYIEAEVKIPEHNLKIDITISKNKNRGEIYVIKVNINFVIRSKSKTDSVLDIRLLQVREENLGIGQDIPGRYYSNGRNNFKIDLEKGNVEVKTVDMIRSHDWMDLPVLFSSGNRGKITFEKGLKGRKIWQSILQNWGM